MKQVSIHRRQNSLRATERFGNFLGSVAECSCLSQSLLRPDGELT